MHHNTPRHKVDTLIDFAVEIYQFLETYEQNLLQQTTQELGLPDTLNTNISIRKRVLRYLILDIDQAFFQALWTSYQDLFRELYGNSHIRSASPLQDDLFASREILEDTLVEVWNKDTFKQVFLQKAYRCFGVDFQPIQENCLFAREAEEDIEQDESDINFEDEQSQVCRLM